MPDVQELWTKGACVGKIIHRQEKADPAISPKLHPWTHRTIQAGLHHLVDWDTTQRQCSLTRRIEVRHFFPHLNRECTSLFDSIEWVMDVPSWAPRIKTAHFSVGKELRGGTPEESEASSKRTDEISSNRESRAVIPANKVKIVNSTTEKVT